MQKKEKLLLKSIIAIVAIISIALMVLQFSLPISLTGNYGKQAPQPHVPIKKAPTSCSGCLITELGIMMEGQSFYAENGEALCLTVGMSVPLYSRLTTAKQYSSLQYFKTNYIGQCGVGGISFKKIS